MPLKSRGKPLISGESLSSSELLLCGAAAGLSGRFVTAPIDRVRILYQVNSTRSFSVAKSLKTIAVIARETGAAGLWRGNGAAMMRVAPSSALSFTTFDRYERALRKASEKLGYHNSFAIRFIAGSAAGATAQTLTYPLDLLMARNASYWNKQPRYSSYSTAFVQTIRMEGVAGLFRGLTPALMGMLPYAGLNFALFETFKVQMSFLTQKGELSAYHRLICGGLAGLIAQTATYPIHIIKRRMQVSTEPVYKSFRTGFMHVLKTEGLRGGLFKGVLLTWLRGPIAVAIGFTVNDYMKLQFLNYHDSMGAPQQPARTEDTTAELDAARTFHSLIAGASAGAVAKTVIAPADRVKILYQVNPDRTFTWKAGLRTATQIYKETGVLGLWRGHGATLMRVAPYAAVTYSSFDKYESLLQSRISDKSPMTRFMAGALAGATATTVTYPLDLLRARHASHWGLARPDASYAAAIQRIVQTEGVSALFNGLRPTLLGIVPYAGISFSTFHTLKAQSLGFLNLEKESDIPIYLNLAMGAAAGLVAQSATYPLDIVRRRMQVHVPPYKSIFQAVTTIFKNEGRRGMYKGLSMNWIKGPISVGISFTTNDYIKHWFRVRREQSRERVQLRKMSAPSHENK